MTGELHALNPVAAAAALLVLAVDSPYPRPEQPVSYSAVLTSPISKVQPKGSLPLPLTWNDLTGTKEEAKEDGKKTRKLKSLQSP